MGDNGSLLVMENKRHIFLSPFITGVADNLIDPEFPDFLDQNFYFKAVKRFHRSNFTKCRTSREN
jgi:hypothetical protein